MRNKEEYIKKFNEVVKEFRDEKGVINREEVELNEEVMKRIKRLKREFIGKEEYDMEGSDKDSNCWSDEECFRSCWKDSCCMLCYDYEGENKVIWSGRNEE